MRVTHLSGGRRRRSLSEPNNLVVAVVVGLIVVRAVADHLVGCATHRQVDGDGCVTVWIDELGSLWTMTAIGGSRGGSVENRVDPESRRCHGDDRH